MGGAPEVLYGLDTNFAFAAVVVTPRAFTLCLPMPFYGAGRVLAVRAHFGLHCLYDIFKKTNKAVGWILLLLVVTLLIGGYADLAELLMIYSGRLYPVTHP